MKTQSRTDLCDHPCPALCALEERMVVRISSIDRRVSEHRLRADAEISTLRRDLRELLVEMKRLTHWRSWTTGAAAAIGAAFGDVLLKHFGVQ